MELGNRQGRPVIEESHMTLIALIDRVRMLDNDLIRLRTKLDMILQQQEMMKNEKDNNDATTGSTTNESE